MAMLELVRFSQPQPARVLQQVLARDGIAAQVREEGTETVLYIEDAARFEAARRVLDDFLADPGAARFQQHAWMNSEPIHIRGPRPPLVTGRWWRSLGPVTRVVLIACVLIFLTPLYVGDSVYLALMFPPELADLRTQPWRLVTPALLHLSVLHILFNLLWWQELGRVIEGFQSSTQLVLISLATAVVSNVAQFHASGPNFGGLSGVVYGLLGYLWLYGRVNPAAGYGLRPEIVMFMLAWLVIAATGVVGNVANTAHFAGLISGCALGAATGFWRRTRHYRDHY